MADRPILMSGPMVRAVLEGRKTQTRRVITKLRGFGEVSEFGRSDTPGYDWHFRDRGMRWHDLRHDELLKALPYATGDWLYVREAIYRDKMVHLLTGERTTNADVAYYSANDGECVEAAGFNLSWVWKRKSLAAMHMPRSFSRITLIVKDVRVERVCEISANDAKAEGLNYLSKDDGRTWKYGIADRDGLPGTDNDGWPWAEWKIDPRPAYRTLWNSLNEKRGFGWAVNPWVVVVTFEPILANIDELVPEIDVNKMRSAK